MMIEVAYDRPHLYDKQADFVDCASRYSICEATTKAGKTVGCLVWQIEKIMADNIEGHHHWWVAPVRDVAKIAYNRAKLWLKRSDIPEKYIRTNEQEQSIQIINGAKWWFKGAEKPDHLYGEDVYSAVLDEATRMREESWHAIRTTTTATRAPIKIIGNVKGRRNWAYRLARRAEQKQDDTYRYFKLTAWDAVEGGILARDEILDAQEVLPDAVFRELYLAEPSDDGGNPFGIAAIEKCIIESLSGEKPVAWGWDLAKSQDWTVGIGLDRQGHLAAYERWQRIPWEKTIEKIALVTGRTQALVDSTGVGDPIVERLEGMGPFEGYKFTSLSKQQLMEGLAVAIQSRLVGFPDKLDDLPLRDELEIFEYEATRTGVRYTAPEGFHDDCVCSFALAYRKLQQYVPFAIQSGGERELADVGARMSGNGKRGYENW